jgi:hypothetical protein
LPAAHGVHTAFAVAVHAAVCAVPGAHTEQFVHGAEPLALKVEPPTQAWPCASSGSAAAAASSSSSVAGRCDGWRAMDWKRTSCGRNVVVRRAIRRRRSSLELARGDRPGPLDVQSFSAAKG